MITLSMSQIKEILHLLWLMNNISSNVNSGATSWSTALDFHGANVKQKKKKKEKKQPLTTFKKLIKNINPSPYP